MWENVKTGLLVVALFSAFFLLRPYLPRLSPFMPSKPQVVVKYATAVQGRVTGSDVNRQHHLYYLDGTTWQYYDFNAFGQPLTPVQAQLSLEEQNMLGLGQRLKTGDSVSKSANSTLLTVQRGDSISRWFCATPQEIERAQ